MDNHSEPASHSNEVLVFLSTPPSLQLDDDDGSGEQRDAPARARGTALLA